MINRETQEALSRVNLQGLFASSDAEREVEVFLISTDAIEKLGIIKDIIKGEGNKVDKYDKIKEIIEKE